MTKKKFYAVAAGIKPGIYDTWPEAQKQVTGYAGAKFKGFTDRTEAEAWLRNPQYSHAPVRKKSAVDAKLPPLPCRLGEINIYTDGGCSHNPGPGGYGAILVYDDIELEICGGFQLTTNNRMELMACIMALQHLELRDRPITIWSDSSYVVNGISKGWAKGWRQRGWIKADRQPAVNPDLWGDLLLLVEALDVTFQWVKGHSGHPFNERCDKMAIAALKKAGLAIDEGYSGR